MGKKKNISVSNGTAGSVTARKGVVPGGAAGGRGFLATLATNNGPKIFLYQKICVFLVAFLVFANGIPNGFNLDDVYYTTAGNTLSNKGLKAIPEIFTTHTIHDVSNNSFDYRPIPMLSFALQHQFFGPSAVVGHFINVLLYALTCMLLFVLLSNWMGVERRWASFLIILLYTVHPLHTEVVDNIKNRDELLATLFCALSLIYIWQWYATRKQIKIVFSALLFIMALLCKTTAIIYAAIIPAAFYFFTDMPVKKIILSVSIYAAVAVAFVSLINILLPQETRTFLFFENPMYAATISFWTKTATVSYILGWYSWLHVFPHPLSFYYGYKYVQLMQWSDLLPIVSCVLYLLAGYFIIRNIKRKSLAAFGILFYLICILPFSNLFAPAPGMMAERFTFDSTLGYSIVVVSALYYLGRKPGMRSAGNVTSWVVVLPFLLMFFSYAAESMVRNTEWENSWVLYSHDIPHLQESVKANMLYGEQVITKSNQWRSEFEQTSGEEQQLYRDSILRYLPEEKAPFLRVLAIAPDYSKAMNNLALAYIHDDSLEEAKRYLLRACALMDDKEDNPNTHYNLAIVYGNLAAAHGNDIGLMDSSIIEFKKVIRLSPGFLAGYSMLEQTYLTMKDTIAAEHILLTGIGNAPDESMLYAALANIYMYQKDTARAIHYYEQGAAVTHPDPVLFRILQSYYHEAHNVEKENYYRSRMTTSGNSTGSN